MSHAGRPLDHCDAIEMFCAGLPTNNTRYVNLRKTLEHHVNRTPDDDLPPMDDLFDAVLDIDNTLQRTRPLPATRTRPGTSTSAPRSSSTAYPPRAAGSSSATTTTITTKNQDPCGNCGGAHPTPDCYQKGGAMEGRRDEVLSRRAFRTKVQAHIAVPDGDPPDTSPDESHADTIQIEDTIPLDDPVDTAFVSVASAHVNNDIFLLSYVFAAVSEDPVIASIASEDSLFSPTVQPVVFMSCSHLFNSLLDSGCTDHLICDRRYFWTYSTTESVSIKTANCGSMTALGRGDVKFRVHIGDQPVVWTLKDCLHAPEVPVNLLSVGAMQDAGIDFHFPGGPVVRDTILYLPKSLSSGPRLRVLATRVNRLSFLQCNFLDPPAPLDPVPPTVFPVFPNSTLSPDLWHRCLGHPSREITRLVLTKPGYATGVSFVGSFDDTRCVSCVLGKAPQAPYASHNHRPSELLDVVHIDIMGSFPVASPRKGRFLLDIVDGKSTYGRLIELRLKSDSHVEVKCTIALWENQTGHRVKAVRMDGAKEFVEGDLGNFLRDSGIAIQQTALYAHQQAGLIERRNRTIQDGAQTLLADAGCLPSYFFDAALCFQYVKNRLPSVVLPAGSTPYGLMNGGAVPDLQHLRPFGCRCFPKAIGVRWVFDFKFHPNHSIIHGKEKARLVAQGCGQLPEDYGDTYAPVVKLVSIRIILAWAAMNDHEVMAFDVKTAFLHALFGIDERPQYIKQIPGFLLEDPSLVLRLWVSLYGLRQSVCKWYRLLASRLKALGLVRCEVDHAVFFGRWESSPHPSIPPPPPGTTLFLIVPVHVDDGLVVTNSLPLYAWFIKSLLATIDIVDLGPASLYLGMRITRDRSARKLWLSQRGLVSDLLDQWGMSDVKPASNPLPMPLSKLPEAPDNALPGLLDADLKLFYQRIIGTATYLGMTTHPELAPMALALSQFNANPTRTHMLAAKGLLRYLTGALDTALQFPAPLDDIPASVCPYTQACGLSDVDWASDVQDRKSVSGFAFYVYGSLVSWSSSKQKAVSTSSTESEYYAMAHAMKEALWIRSFMSILDFPFPQPFPLLCDNQSTIRQLNNPDSVNVSKSKHIDVKYHFTRQFISDKTFDTVWIPTDEMVADIFTKALPTPTFLKHRGSLGNVSVDF
jgi:hypothetical protein